MYKNFTVKQLDRKIVLQHFKFNNYINKDYGAKDLAKINLAFKVVKTAFK